MATETLPPRTSPVPEKPEGKPTVKKNKTITPGRRRMLTAVTTLALAIPGVASGVNLAHKFQHDSESGYSLSSENQLNVETHSFPAEYKHDFVLPPIDGLAATDAGASVELSPGVFLVTYSDTYLGKLGAMNLKGEQGIMPKSENMINNCAIIFDENKKQYTVLKGPKNKFGYDTSWITPPEKDGSYFWLQTPIVEDGKLYVSLAQNKPDPKNIWDYLGTRIAVFDISTGLPVKDKQQPFIELPRTESETNWGAAIVQDGKKEFTYIYGTVEPKENNPYHTKELRIARVPYGKMADLSKWQFLSENVWNSIDPQATTNKQTQESWKDAEKTAKPIIDYTQGISDGFSANIINGKFVLTTKEEDILGNKVLSFIGKSPEGPFTKHTVIDDVQALVPENHKPTNGEALTYLAYLHPEVKDPENHNRILITISTMPNTDNPERDILNNVFTYKPFSVWVDQDSLLK